jgi:hypothetical protein
MILKAAWELYKKPIIIFSIIMIIIIIVGYAWLFNYYKDVSKSNYVVVTCEDPNKPGEFYEERYNSVREFKESPTICGVDKIANSLKTWEDIELNLSFH